ncbi:MAG TPA: PP2C family protein-serine/threonine phosphatase [Bryobacteraceae bacterium]|nr:PP2C family protein-serine/threonine phosphatase [Bryobacteraceae bacterium]
MDSAVPALAFQTKLRSQLAERRSRLETSIQETDQASDLLRLLGEVDAALDRLDGHRYGKCTVCHEEVEAGDLEANPMATYCLCRLTPERQRALERDLDLAWHVQAALLPPLGLAAAGWQTHYRYIPHGPVSGDYCDLVEAEGGLYFMLGDVSGKGVSASLLMAHLNATLRGFARRGLAPEEAMCEANRLFAESTLASHYVTLVCGRANSDGAVELVNAGHCAPMLVRSRGGVETLEPSGLPLGLALPGAPPARFPAQRIALGEGDALVLYTDGLTEAVNASDDDYGAARLSQVLATSARKNARELVARSLADLTQFLAGDELRDDLTILALVRG